MPEEVNRVLTDHISDLLFCPSNKSVQQLKAEGIQRNVFDVGDVMYDAMLTFSKISDPNILDNYDISLTEGEFNLLTIHRPSNTDNYAHIKQIVNALGKIGSRFIWPLHPRTRKVIAGFKLDIPGNIIMVEPFSYLEILKVLSSCSKVITDSGGMQKEAYWMKKPCITLREETEWTETLANHWNFLAGSDESRITQAIKMNIDPSTWEPLYGDGKASLTIARIIKEFLSN